MEDKLLDFPYVLIVEICLLQKPQSDHNWTSSFQGLYDLNFWEEMSNFSQNLT